MVEATFPELHEDVFIWRLEPLRLMLELEDMEVREVGGEVWWSKLRRCLCLVLMRRKLILFPLREVSAYVKSCGHYTLLLLDLRHAATFKYHDTLNEMSPLCLKASEICMRWCIDVSKGLNMPENWPHAPY